MQYLMEINDNGKSEEQKNKIADNMYGGFGILMLSYSCRLL